MDQPDKAARLIGLQALAKTAKLEELDPISLHLLGARLNAAGDSPQAESVLRTAQQRYPSNLWVNYELGRVLEKMSRRDEAIRFYTAGRAIRPESAHELAHALESRGDSDEAIAVFRDLIRLSPGNARHLQCLGEALEAKGLSREAGEMFEAAVASARESIRLRPNGANAHHALGAILCDCKRDYPAAEAEFRTAIRLMPEAAHAHFSLGNALMAQGKLDEAVAEFRTAIRLEPDMALYHGNIGVILYRQGKLDEAITEWREAIRLKPDYTFAHQNLGSALSAQGKRDEAITEWREAIRLKPDYAYAHKDLGNALARQGKFDEAVSEFRRAAELVPSGSPVAREMLGRIRTVEQQIALAQRLPAVLRGDDKPKENTERLTFAQTAYDRKHFAAAARLWSEALESDPKLGDDRQAMHRYNAACAAALAAAGQGKDEPSPDAAAKAKLRRQALDWLKNELTAWCKLLESGPPQARPFIAQTLQHWRKDTDLGGIREAEALAKLPADEQKACARLWTDAAELLKKASAPPSPASLRQQLPEARKALAKDSPQLAGLLAQIGLGLLEQKKWTEAEPLLRECLAIREKTQPDEWTTFNTRSLLGGSLLGQKKYAEAEPLILSAYEGMKAREANIPPPGKPRFADAAERVVKLYEAWDKKDKAALWRAELAKPSEAPKPQS